MSNLVIKSVGPIKDVHIELRRFNVLIGEQSSGKSTIAKVLSTCMWIEKEVSTTLDVQAIKNGKEFPELIERYHKLMTHPVQWTGITNNMATDGVTGYYEVGTDDTLQKMVRRMKPDLLVASGLLASHA